ncbi:hypothetical protein THIOM_000199 [Candidatus Thiomargarita nelsonii]|uniref:Uncharacterized protein n=1 Tax=Candidatus Thiomargarita nelsonii TaxID=1003181 RepID=A0A176S7R2_9GAMM|nr:hypothetical protein THIOM_000199 [Candidatus Thiomargarita nelsonii]
MSTCYRKFEAPSSVEGRLPIDQSPWHFERYAQIPLRHWEMLIEFAKEIDADRAIKLEDSSVGSFENDDYLNLSEADMTAVISFMEEMKERLGSTQSIFPLLKDRVFNDKYDMYDEYENDEYQRMLEAVITVYKESQRLGEPVCAYND